MDYMLLKYDDINETEYNDYITEWENNNEPIVPSATSRKGRSFNKLMAKWKTDETDKAFENGFVPSTLYFLVNNNRRIIGAIHFRHILNKRLIENGGNIGYGIRQSERRKGFAEKMLNLLIKIIKESDIEKVLLTCNEDNAGSYRTIEKCNGILQDKILFENVWTRRYWIEIKKDPVNPASPAPTHSS